MRLLSENRVWLENYRVWIVSVCCLVVGMIAGLLWRSRPGPVSERVVVKTKYDTVMVRTPEASSSRELGTGNYSLPRYVLLTGGGVKVAKNEGLSAKGCDGRVQDCQVAVLDSVSAGEDSVTLRLPIVQRHYIDSLYEAWVSGPVDPRLDSVRVTRRTDYITRVERERRRRWHIGVTGGYGYSAKGLVPYVGIGITYSIFSF